MVTNDNLLLHGLYFMWAFLVNNENPPGWILQNVSKITLMGQKTTAICLITVLSRQQQILWRCF